MVNFLVLGATQSLVAGLGIRSPSCEEGYVAEGIEWLSAIQKSKLRPWKRTFEMVNSMSLTRMRR